MSSFVSIPSHVDVDVKHTGDDGQQEQEQEQAQDKEEQNQTVTRTSADESKQKLDTTPIHDTAPIGTATHNRRDQHTSSHHLVGCR